MVQWPLESRGAKNPGMANLRAFLVFAAGLLLTAPAPGQSLRDLMTDDEDGRFDVSELLFARPLSFLPIPIVITEPALGYGGGLVPVFFHEPPDRSSGQLVTPSVSVLAGFLTSDGSQGGGGGHFHSWKSDTWRALGFAGRASLELESAGIRGDSSLEYSIDTDFLLLEGSRKVTDRTRLGLRYIYAESEVGFQESESDFSISGGSAVGGLGLFLGFDTRDSMVSPRKGHRVDLRPAYFSEAFGGDFDYVRIDTLYTGYWKRDPLTFALRLDANWIEDEAPFYAKPYIALRGVPVMAFLGDQVLSAEPEIDWNITSRWALVAFAGAGRTTNESRNSEVYSGGVGFRYLLARVLGLQAGLDFAWSSEGDSAFYIVMGSPWL